MNSPLILIIDDEPQICRFLGISLRSQGYRVDMAESAAEGLKKARQLSPNLIILDLGLPDADGQTLLLSLRQQLPDARVLVLSVRNDETGKVTALDAGASDYVTKPFGIQEFLARVRRILRNETSNEPVLAGHFRSGPLAVDPATRQVQLDGQRVHLTPKEYAVLERLIRQPGTVITQTQLLEQIWGPTQMNIPQ